ncbi:HPF/RaiA family ribosome-associated protein [Dyella ginsengisoli]|uniref:HPF/RaiA family ribosome-associated protein n=1 Tax=Dyella ginsengisoli TaxID=363848 RepID=UPI000346652B|nr:HPF/RaiA family ribosome-associated protein [Dyella ginsengisoli]
MSFLIEVSFLDMRPSKALYEDISRHALQLEHFAPTLTDCRITVRHAEARHRSGHHYRVQAQVSLPGAQFEARRETGNDTHADVHVAVRDTFAALRRQLQDFLRVRRGEVKHHERPDAR